MLKSLTLLRDRIADPTVYPFCMPTIAALTTLQFTSRVTCFAGENGSGKSTLLEAIAAHIGFGQEGGNRNYSFETKQSAPRSRWRALFDSPSVAAPERVSTFALRASSTSPLTSTRST